MKKIILKHHPVGDLASIISDFIQFKRSLGYIYKTEEGILQRFSLFSMSYTIKENEIPLQLIEGWIERRNDEKASTQKTRSMCVLQMLNFASKHGYIVHFPVLMKKINVPKYIPYIFTKKELERFFYACDNLQPYPGTSRHHTIPVLFRLIYSCGLRASEAANLKCSDVDIKKDAITVRDGKNGKQRIVALSDSMAQCMEQFSHRYHHNKDKEKYFFKGKYKSKIDRYIIYKWFRICLEAAGIPHMGKGQGPREHDLSYPNLNKIQTFF